MKRNPTFRIRAGRSGAIGVGLLASALLLTGCSGSEADSASDAQASAQAAASAIAAAASAAASAASAAASAAGVPPVGTVDAAPPAGGAVTAEELCAQLKETQPKLDKVGTPVGAMAQLVGDIASLYSSKGAMAAMDGAQMDEMVAQSCPDVGAKALKSAGLASFSAL